MAIVKIDGSVNDDSDGQEGTNGAAEVRVVRNCYESDSIDAPVEDGFDNDGSDEAQRYDDPAASGEYDPGLSVKGVGFELGEGMVARTGRMEFDSRPPEAGPHEIVDAVRGGVVLEGNDVGREALDVVGNVVVFDALSELLENGNAMKVFSASNAEGKELEVFLVVTRVSNSEIGALVYDRRVFFDGKEVPFDPYGMLNFSSFDSQDQDAVLVGNMFAAYGLMVEKNLGAVIDDVENWMRQLASMDRGLVGNDNYEKEKSRGVVQLSAGNGKISGVAAEGTMSVEELFEVLGLNCSELNEVGNLIGFGDLFRRMMPPTPMNRMIAHMVESPVRSITAFIADLIDARTPDDVQFCLSALYQNLNRLYAIATKFLPLIAEDGVLPHAVNIREMCESLRECVGSEEVKARVDIDVDPELEGLLSRPILWPIVENALYNAVKSGADSISMTAEVVDGAVVVSIIDNGVSVPVHVLQHLFVDPVKSTTGGSGRGSSTASEVFHGLVTRGIFKDLGASDLPGRERFGIGLIPGKETKRFWVSLPVVGKEERDYLAAL